MRDAPPHASWLDTLARPVPSDWLAFAYGVPMKWQPGGRYVYSSLNAFLVGAVVEQVLQMPFAAFAEEHLFGPLGITRYEWRRGPRSASSELPGTADMACK